MSNLYVKFSESSYTKWWNAHLVPKWKKRMHCYAGGDLPGETAELNSRNKRERISNVGLGTMG